MCIRSNFAAHLLWIGKVKTQYLKLVNLDSKKIRVILKLVTGFCLGTIWNILFHLIPKIITHFPRTYCRIYHILSMMMGRLLHFSMKTQRCDQCHYKCESAI